MGESSIKHHETVIEPATGWFEMDWRELWEYRDLLYLLTRRDFVARYKQTLLGPLWFIVQPLLQTLVFAIVFGRVAGIPTDGVPGPLFYLCGLLSWTYFSQTITAGANMFANSAHLFTKVYFPRVVVPLAAVISNSATFFLQLLPFIAFYVYYRATGQAAGDITLTWNALWLPLLIIQTMALSLGVTLWMAAASAKYRDLAHLNQFLIQIWLFATPIIYPLSKVNPEYRWLAGLNPMSAIVEAFRSCLLNRGTLDQFLVGESVLLTLLILVSGLILFQRIERNVADSV